MNHNSFETWLSGAAKDIAEWRSKALEHERREIQQLEDRLNLLETPTDWQGKLQQLRGEETALDGEIGTWNVRLGLLREQIISEVRNVLAECKAWESATTLTDTQDLFDSYAPRDLRESIETSSIVMLHADLESSRLPERLHDIIEKEVSECAREFVHASAVGDNFQSLIAERDSLRAQVDEIRQRLADHGVTTQTLRSIESIEEPERFLEDVIQPCTAAAEVELEWSLPRNILEELRRA